MTATIALIAAYLLGSIPTGFLFARARGIDIRSQGSGSTGATNVGRSLGTRTAALVMIFDVVKGAAAVLLALALSDGGGVAAGAGLLAMVGHAFPVWIGFRGGKAVATGLGATAALIPVAAPIVVGVWVILVVATRFVSAASIGAALSLPAVALLLQRSGAEIAFATAAAALVVALHHANIARLLRGQERRIRSVGRRRAE